MHDAGTLANAFRRRVTRERLRKWVGGLPRLAFVLSVAVLGFANGFLVRETKLFPYSYINDGLKTLTAIRDQILRPFAPYQFEGFTKASIGEIGHRIIVREPAPSADPTEHFLLSGGSYQYLDYCPTVGCLAVEFTRSGRLLHAYPFRPDEFEAHLTVSLPYEEPLFDFAKNVYPIGLLKLPDGDLIVTLQQWNTFPYGGGIARVHRDGTVAWFRHDYSHHWPRLLADGDIVTPAMQIVGSRAPVSLAGEVYIDLKCRGKIMRDIIRIIGQDGHTRQEISVYDAFLQSPYRGLLVDAPEPCDPLHLNYVVPVTPDLLPLYKDAAADDLMVSLHNVDAFAILGRRDHRLKYLFSGTFVAQHSVQPLGRDGTVLMFDNRGADWQAGPSRLLAYDLKDGTERRLLPNPNAPGVKFFSDTLGSISISPDRSRVIVASTNEGRAYELRLSDGHVLTVFNDIHDLHGVPEAGSGHRDAAARFALYNAEYSR